jgi:hypothetical protein
MTAVEQLETFCICDLTGEPELCPGGKFCEIHQGGEFQAPSIVGKIIAGYKEKLLYFQREYQDEAGRTQVIAAATERAQEGLETTVDDRARVARMHPNASLLAKACRDIDHLLAKIADAKAALTMERRSRDRAELALLQAEPESIPIKSRAADAARQNNLLDQPLRGHPRFYQLTAAENELHARKNSDYAGDGRPMGNFERVAQILSLYPGLRLTDDYMVGMVYMMKQLDAALHLLSEDREGQVEGVGDRLGDIGVYVKLIRIMYEERGK